MTPEAIERAAIIIAENRLKRTRLGLLDPVNRPADLGDAYSIQERHNEILSERGFGKLVGYKIGCTTPVMQEYLNIHEPIFGEIFDSMVFFGQSEVKYADFVEPGIEAELAVSLVRDLPITGAPYTTESICDAVGAAMTSIEVVDARYHDYRELDTPTMAADNFFNAAVVLGEPLKDWNNFDLAAAEASVKLNGTEFGRGLGSLIMGHPLVALTWLANRLAERHRFLRAGEFVTLGSVIPTYWASKGDCVDHEVSGLGSVSIKLD